MRARALFAGTVGALLLAVATTAAAKSMIAEAQHQRPGIGRRRSAHLRSGHGWDVGLRDRYGWGAG